MGNRRREGAKEKEKEKEREITITRECNLCNFDHAYVDEHVDTTMKISYDRNDPAGGSLGDETEKKRSKKMKRNVNGTR